MFKGTVVAGVVKGKECFAAGKSILEDRDCVPECLHGLPS